MKLIAITGTTGKMTVAHYVHEILKSMGEQGFVIELMALGYHASAEDIANLSEAH